MPNMGLSIWVGSVAGFLALTVGRTVSGGNGALLARSFEDEHNAETFLIRHLPPR